VRVFVRVEMGRLDSRFQDLAHLALKLVVRVDLFEKNGAGQLRNRFRIGSVAY
jgi:hypothetical protein